jgi:hypothetical protein
MTTIKSRRRVHNENYVNDPRFAAETDKLLDDVCACLDYQGWTSAVLVYEKGSWSIIRLTTTKAIQDGVSAFRGDGCAFFRGLQENPTQWNKVWIRTTEYATVSGSATMANGKSATVLKRSSTENGNLCDLITGSPGVCIE